MVDESRKFTQLVRVGYFARAVLYIVLGTVALTSASRIAEGTDGVFAAIAEYPAGMVILWLMVIGLFAYALFRACSPLFDIENEGSDTKGWVRRAGHAGSALGHLALAWSAYRLATSGRESSGGAQEAAAGILTMSLGGVVLGLLGLAFFVTAFFQFRKGLTGEFRNRINAGAPEATRWLGLAGYCARGVVYLVIGWSLVKAGFLSGGAQQVKTLGDALASLADEGALFTLTAIGLILFGLFSLVLARFRCIPDFDPTGKIPKFRSH
jgi:hypothetical protein